MNGTLANVVFRSTMRIIAEELNETSITDDRNGQRTRA